jgi:hypothetical protein
MYADARLSIPIGLESVSKMTSRSVLFS